MTDANSGSGNPNPSLVGVMPEVVKGLKDKPALLFGIGAGIILVVVLGITTDVWIAVVVAAVLVACLIAWVFIEARKVTGPKVHNSVRLKGGRMTDSNAGIQGAVIGDIDNRVKTEDADVSGSNLGVSFDPTGSKDN
jgi:hypothetical protein